jgi:hypothetical protein
MDFTDLFYSQVQGRDSLLSGLESLLGTEMHTATLMPYGSDFNPEECFKLCGSNRKVVHMWTREGASLFKLTYYPIKGSRKEHRLEGRFFTYEHPTLPNVFIIMTIESVDFVRRALIPLLEQNRSHIYLTFIRHQDLHRLLQGFRNIHGYSDLRVVRTSLISRFDAEKGETMISSVNWPRLGLEGAFAYAEDQNGWFRSLTFEVLKESRVVAETTISRNGVVKTDGDLHGVYESLVSPICELISDNLRLFAKRSRRDNPLLGVRPLSIEFPKEQFANIEENARFIGAIRKLDNASVSVLHGNPYIALSVIDNLDGSTFDLWVLNERELVIVPQMKSSVVGIKRLISGVFDNYAEGTIKEFSMGIAT